MKMIYRLFLMLLPVLYLGCKEKEKQKEKNEFISALSFIQSQVRHMDTSLYFIIKAEKTGTDSTWDTSYVKREEFRGLAKDFLDIPDITDYSIGKNYKEDTVVDSQLNMILFIYTPKIDNQEIAREEIVIGPDATGSDKMKSIIIEKLNDKKDSTIHQRLLWQTDEKFQVVTIIEKNGQPVSTKTMEVTWNKRED